MKYRPELIFTTIIIFAILLIGNSIGGNITKFLQIFQYILLVIGTLSIALVIIMSSRY